MIQKFLFTTACLIISISSYADLSFSTYNIRNFDYDRRSNTQTNKPQLKKIIENLNTDIVAVQEIVNKKEFETFVDENLKGHKVVLTDCGGSGKQKLGFLYKNDKIVLEKFLSDHRISNSDECNRGLRPAGIAHFRVKKTNKKFVAITVHLKAGGRQANADVRYRQYQKLSELINELKSRGSEKIVILGDFNTTDYVLRNQNYQRFIDFTDEANLIDFSTGINCSSYWFGGTDDNLETPSLLDHILITEKFFDDYFFTETSVEAHCKLLNCQEASPEELGISFQEVSDHCPIVTNLQN